ncbi:hypothetical protein [Clostridium magnum]|uniref:Uncharacterized protein n=1 Tax=Clostridium magnum DSM 2767 TaxID=1121326 RepID=A0A161XD35_9CLOT|nr:hypothetical protein [Clostridium magnum]KZL92246.1 hypothetical protein CLMAG_20550 [Clostridium magnum DSM 2767]SHH16365.1 hypothetical protein SAMN02745944_00171 [Clostridium magnum DSM 2767]
MEKTTNKENFVENAFEKFKDHQSTMEKTLYEEQKKKREDTYQKFQHIKKLLNQNIYIEEILKNIKDELKFNIQDVVKSNRKYYRFLTLAMIITFIMVSWFIIPYLNSILFLIPIALVFILTIFIGCYIINHVRQRKIYKKHINQCNKLNIINENILNLIGILLDNYIEITNILPRSFVNYCNSKKKSNFDMYIFFLWKNTKTLSKKLKNKKLRYYNRLYSNDIEILQNVEILQHHYFQSIFTSCIVDTIEECSIKFLQDN